MDIKKILWPNDLSNCSESSLPYVSSLAKKYDAKVYVLYVSPDLTRHESWYGDLDSSHIHKVMEWEKKKADEKIQTLCERHLADCKIYSKHVVVGDPAAEILNFIEKEGIDMVVMCRKGEGGRFDMGSVSERVVSHSPVPVFITQDGVEK